MTEKNSGFSDLKKRFATAIVLLAIVFLAIYAGGLSYEVLIVAAMGSCLLEAINMGLKTSTSRGLGLSLILILFFTWIGRLFMWIINIPHGKFWLVVVIISATLVDTLSYFVGKKFEFKRIISPLINARKTYGTAFLSALISLPFIISLLGINRIPFLEIIMLAFFLALAPIAGDLFNSRLKRVFGVKGSGFIFPGHGGIVDRAMSLFMVLLAVTFYLGQLSSAIILILICGYLVWIIGISTFRHAGDVIFDFFNKSLDLIAYPVVSLADRYYSKYPIIRHLPNAFGVIRLVFCWVPCVLYVRAIYTLDPVFLVWALLAGIAIGLTDAFDGRVARKLGLAESEFGKRIDPLADKIFTFAVTGIVFYAFFLLPREFLVQLSIMALFFFYLGIEFSLIAYSSIISVKQKGLNLTNANNSGKTKFMIICLTTIIVGACNFLVLKGVLPILVLDVLASFGLLLSIFFGSKSLIGYLEALKGAKA